jgi:hypothetical protein
MLIGIVARPLADARTTGVGQHNTSDFLENTQVPISINGKRTSSEPGVTVYSDFTFNPLSSACCATEAARVISSYELFVHEPISPHFQLFGPAIFYNRFGEIRYRMGEVGRERPVDMRFEIREMDFNHLVKIFFRMGIYLRVTCQVNL